MINFNRQPSTKNFNIDMINLLPQDKKIPFGASLGILNQGKRTNEHRHDELETFIIIKGKGRLELESEITEVNEGDVIHFQPFQSHSLSNIGTEDLQFVSLYWRDSTESATVAVKKNHNLTETVYVTSTPPTPNGDLHLGHLSGPYLGADVYTRYLKLRGIEAYHISGIDDFQSYVPAKARQLDFSSEETADHFAAEIKATFDAINIHFDYYTRPLHSEDYQTGLTQFVYDLWKKNILYIQSGTAFFDSHSDEYLYEVYLKGKCPHCNSLGCGNICEECGHPNQCIDMLETISNLSNTRPNLKKIKRLHFPLSQYAEAIAKHQYKATMSTRLRVLYNQLLVKGFPDIAVTHPSEWGVSVPIDDLKNQTIWVWFEMAFGFLFSIRELEKNAGRSATHLAIPPNARIVHFFGYDNAFYHTILFPAIYTALSPEQSLPIDYCYNEFYLLEGRKFSTSREHAIWGKEILKDFSADEIRFYCALTRPETSRTNFTKKDFINFYQNEYVEIWRKWLIDLNDRIKTYFSGSVPDAGIWTIEQRQFYAKLQNYISCIAETYEIVTFSLQKLARLICELVRETIAFSHNEFHWLKTENCQSEYRTAIAIEIAAVRLLALLTAPLMPTFSDNLWVQLGETDSPENNRWPNSVALAKPGNVINLIDPPIGKVFPQ